MQSDKFQSVVFMITSYNSHFILYKLWAICDDFAIIILYSIRNREQREYIPIPEKRTKDSCSATLFTTFLKLKKKPQYFFIVDS